MSGLIVAAALISFTVYCVIEISAYGSEPVGEGT